VDVNVSEKHTVSIFRAEDGDSMFLRKRWHLPTSQHGAKTQNKKLYHPHRRENLKPHILISSLQVIEKAALESVKFIISHFKGENNCS
jgi:hypothetical protein